MRFLYDANELNRCPVWLYCSLATRFCTPLGLNHLEGVCTTAISLRDANAEDKHTLSIKPALIPPPVDEAERYERAMVSALPSV